MKPLVVFCDACVLYPAPIRDLLMACALNDLMQLKWSHKVLNEWINNLIKNRPDLEKSRLEKTKKLMIEAILDCIVEDYESIEKALKLPDKNDRHVLAAAIVSKSRIIVTANLKDFPLEYLSQFNIKPYHPDDLFLFLAKKHRELFHVSLKECYQKLKNPPLTQEQYLAALNNNCKLTKTVLFINKNKWSLAR